MPGTQPIRVLIVDDDALAREMHREFLARVPGFRVIGERDSAKSAVEALASSTLKIDLVLLDVTLPDGNGADVLRLARARGFTGDVISISGVRDAATVRQMVALGSVHYLIKPFSFSGFRERLAAFRDYHYRARASAGPATQQEVDDLFSALRPITDSSLPKGLSATTLAQILDSVRTRGPTSASEAAAAIGISREVARRYLEYLAQAGRLARAARYGPRGRPQTEYEWNDA